MSFLAGICAFSAKGCRKRHPPKQEADRLIAKYKTTRCRFGKDCRTKGCLYIHPGDEEEANTPAVMSASLFPPLGSPNNGKVPTPTVAPLQNSAWKASPVLPQQRSLNTPVNYANSVYSASTARRTFVPAASASASVPRTTVSPDEELNINAKEFVPGRF